VGFYFWRGKGVTGNFKVTSGDRASNRFIGNSVSQSVSQSESVRISWCVTHYAVILEIIDNFLGFRLQGLERHFCVITAFGFSK